MPMSTTYEPRGTHTDGRKAAPIAMVYAMANRHVVADHAMSPPRSCRRSVAFASATRRPSHEHASGGQHERGAEYGAMRSRSRPCRRRTDGDQWNHRLRQRRADAASTDPIAPRQLELVPEHSMPFVNSSEPARITRRGDQNQDIQLSLRYLARSAGAVAAARSGM